MIEYLAPAFLYSVLKDAFAALRGRRRRLSPADVIQLRLKWKSEIEAKIGEYRRRGYGLDVIVRDMKRINDYPDVDERKKGISAWFRAGLMGTYHKGIMLGLRWTTLTRDKRGEWRLTDYANGEHGEVKVILIGYVLYENVQNVDWDGDEYNGLPQVYCYFDARNKEPYEKTAFCEEHEMNDIPFYTEVAEYDDVAKRSKRLGLTH